jgi:hypothetical protein
MWELRHQIILSELLETLAKKQIPALLLKGTAVAYDIYEQPAQRARGDTDLLVRDEDVGEVRETLTQLAFKDCIEDSALPEALRAQESWLGVADDGSKHFIDLHWRVLNAPALQETFSFDGLWKGRRPLSRLSPAAFAPSRPMLLAHACVHRAFHECSPYFVAGRTYFGGDRSIWLWDLALLGRSLSRIHWEELARFAAPSGLGDVILDGLGAAQRRFGTFCPQDVESELRKAGSNGYLRSGQLGRAAMDWWAIPGPHRKAQYALARLLPSGRFMRAKYPADRNRPLPLLYLRRMGELVRARPTRANGR